MSYETIITWAKTAGKLKDKYDLNLQLLYKKLKSINKGFFHKTDPKLSFFLLFLFEQQLKTQSQLYLRFVNGSEQFHSSIKQNSSDKDLSENLKQLYDLGKASGINVKEQLQLLGKFSTYFENLKKEEYFSEIKSLLYSTGLSEKKIEELSKYILEQNLPNSKEIKKVSIKLIKKYEELHHIEYLSMSTLKTNLALTQQKILEMGNNPIVSASLQYAPLLLLSLNFFGANLDTSEFNNAIKVCRALCGSS